MLERDLDRKSDVVVSVEHVSKKFCRELKRAMMYTSADVARDTLGIRSQTDRLRPGEFWATDDVSFELSRGDCLGLVGSNGAGKSTLLKMLNGIVLPDRGAIRLKGRVGALIEVGAGFHPMLSGRENIYVNGAILWMSRREIDRKFDDIVEFAGLDPGILDAPVKSYSSGMYVRLGFAVAVHCEPEILLIDEVLAVGDGPFVSRCFRKMHELREKGITMILVSHNMVAIDEHCNRALWLEKGGVRQIGPAADVVYAYRGEMARQEAEMRALRLAGPDDDADGAHIHGMTIVDEAGNELREVTCGESVRLRVHFTLERRAQAPVFVIGMKPMEHSFIAAFSSDWDGVPFPPSEPGPGVVELKLPANLPIGTYQVYCLLADGAEFNHLALKWDVGLLHVRPFPRMRNDVYLPHEWHVETTGVGAGRG